jgi:hypothetical protein
MSKYLIILSACLLSLFFSSCNNHKKPPEIAPRQLNVSILLDLSDRIDKKLHPFQVQIDTENIQTIISLFKKQQNDIGVYGAKGKMKIFFYPPPSNTDIISIAKILNIDFNKVDSTSMQGVSEKIKLFQIFDTYFMNNVRKLYQYSSEKDEYPGADIFAFFEDEVDEQCIENSNSYRNILVIITDGYLYWEHDLRNPCGNRYTYIERKTPQLTKFRKMKDWEANFDNEDYGFVDCKKDLSNLEVLVLGIDPSQPEDMEIIKKYWNKWFLNMKIRKENIKLVRTELPVKTNIIEKFFAKK